MLNRVFRVRQRISWVLALLATLAGGPLAQAEVLTPNSPEVKRALANGIAWLETASDSRIGGKALIGLTLLKNGSPKDHPKLMEAVQAIQGIMDGQGSVNPPDRSHFIYSCGLAIIFLVTLDPSKYHPEITALRKYMFDNIKEHGGWGYPERETGDTSMQQYGVLSTWEAAQVGIPAPPEVVESMTGWLMRTQDPAGNFGYQGIDPGPNASRVKQNPRTSPHSMAAAGLSSIYVCADLLNVVNLDSADHASVPAAFKPVDERRDVGRGRAKIDPKRLIGTMNLGNGWMRQNYKTDPGVFTYYYLYAFERFQSFKELAEGKTLKAPKWYDDAARFLIKAQQADGSWKSERDENLTPDSCFACLVLLRSAKKSIEKAKHFGSGALAGGSGMPKEVRDVDLRGGKVVPKQSAPLDDALWQALLDARHEDHQAALESLAAIIAQGNSARLADITPRLRDLIRGADAELRGLAIDGLARTRDVRQAPLLIYALSDPDPKLSYKAHAGLRLLSRNTAGFGLSEKPTDKDRAAGIEKWKSWLVSVWPDARFEE